MSIRCIREFICNHTTVKTEALTRGVRVACVAARTVAVNVDAIIIRKNLSSFLVGSKYKVRSGTTF